MTDTQSIPDLPTDPEERETYKKKYSLEERAFFNFARKFPDTYEPYTDRAKDVISRINLSYDEMVGFLEIKTRDGRIVPLAATLSYTDSPEHTIIKFLADQPERSWTGISDLIRQIAKTDEEHQIFTTAFYNMKRHNIVTSEKTEKSLKHRVTLHKTAAPAP